jgi:DNA-directed RNA polymerase subunit RPC12/RpoP
MHCASCGAVLPDNALFCPGCGQRITVQRRTAVVTPPRTPPPHTIPRDELAAALAARRELGERLEPQVVEAFLDRIERAIDARVDARLDERLRPARPGGREGEDGALPVAICSIVIGVPLTLLGALVGGLPVMIGVGATVALVNAAYAARART